MKYFISFVFVLSVACTFVSAQEWDRSDLEIYETFADFESVLHQSNDTTYVINFWATWCGPCVKELPYFEELHEAYADEKVSVKLVSLDFEKMIDRMVIPFLNRKKIKSEVILLLDGKPNKWIDKVDPKWSGAIPITIVYNKNKRLFFEKSFHSTKELTDIIDSFVK